MTTYTIKPLVWDRVGNTFGASSIIGSFIVYKYDGQWLVSSYLPNIGDVEESCSGPKEGKAKAEAFYLERIKQALVPV